jgi:hypothetical protein
MHELGTSTPSAGPSLPRDVGLKAAKEAGKHVTNFANLIEQPQIARGESA